MSFIASALVLRLFKSGGRRVQVRILTRGDVLDQTCIFPVQLRRYSSGASGGHTPEGHFSSKLRHLLTRRRQEDAVEASGARESFVNAIGLSSPEDKDRVSPEVRRRVYCGRASHTLQSPGERYGLRDQCTTMWATAHTAELYYLRDVDDK